MDHLRLENYEWDAENCCGCKNCIWVDPIYVRAQQYSIRCPSLMRYKFDAYSALGRLKLALALMKGSLKFTATTADIIYKCNLCGACDAGCKRNLDLDPLMVLEMMRIRAVGEGVGPPPALSQINRRIVATGNRYGIRDGGHSPVRAKNTSVVRRAEVAYFVGCNASYKNTSIALSTMAILDYLGIEYALIWGDACCGYPLYISGMVSEALEKARANIALLSDIGATTLITSCAECYKTWKVDYPKLMNRATIDMPYTPMHLVEFIAPLLSNGATVFQHPININVTYHDPCNLGRLSEPWTPWNGTRMGCGITQPPKIYRRGTFGVYHEPRQLLSSIPGLNLIELPRTRENALCCGSGGGVADAYPELAQATALNRVKEIADSEAELVVTACPYCLDSLQAAIGSTNSQIGVCDISELISKALLGNEVRP